MTGENDKTEKSMDCNIKQDHENREKYEGQITGDEAVCKNCTKYTIYTVAMSTIYIEIKICKLVSFCLNSVYEFL